MNKKVADRVFALLLLLFVVGFMAMALQLNTTARRMPIMVAVFTLICLLAYFGGEIWPRKGKAVEKTEKHPSEAACDPDAPPAHDALKWYDVRVWGWLIVLFACILVAGIIPGIGLVTLLFYRIAVKGSWKGAVVFGVLQMAFLYVVFEVAFREEMYRGIIYELMLG